MTKIDISWKLTRQSINMSRQLIVITAPEPGRGSANNTKMLAINSTRI